MPDQFTHGYALLIGVGACAYPAWSLPATVNDATALREALTDPNLCAYPDDEEHVRLLHDEGATRDAILNHLAWLRRRAHNNPDATVVVFFAGHGWLAQKTGDYYLIPHEVKPFDIAGSALPAETFTEALRGIEAQRLLVILDCCHAAGMATARDEPAVELPPQYRHIAPPESVVHALKQGEGRAVFTSSRGNQRSWGRPDGSHGIYTYHLLEALRGAGNEPGDTEVRLSNVMNHLQDTVPASAKQLHNTEQTPYFDMATEDFPVALLRGGRGLSVDWEAMEEDEKREGDFYSATNTGSGAIAQGEGATAAGEGGIAVGGDVSGGIFITGDQNQVD